MFIKTLSLAFLVTHMSRASLSEQAVSIPVGRSSVNARVQIKQSPVVVIATHPWGPMGGSMHDPHPVTVCHLFGEAGCSTARFNFRGGINRGLSSVEDLKAVAAWFTQPRDGQEPIASQVLLIGYSYGTMPAAAAASQIPENIGWATIGPPLDYGWAVYLFNMQRLIAMAADSVGKPKLVAWTRNDVFCGEPGYRSFLERLPEPKETVIMPEDVDHFSYFRYLPKVLKDWVINAFQVPDLKTFAAMGSRKDTTAQCSNP